MKTHMTEQDFMEAETNRPELGKLKSPVSIIETPKSDKSARLTKRRKQNLIRSAGKSKVSPGLLILSDSDSDFLQDSPEVRQKTQTNNSQSEMQVVDVCAKKDLFRIFVSDWTKQSRFSIALACIEYNDKGKENGGGIGGRLINPRRKSRAKCDIEKQEDDRLVLKEFGVIVTGLAVSWDAWQVYYIGLSRSVLSNGKYDTVLKLLIMNDLIAFYFRSG